MKNILLLFGVLIASIATTAQTQIPNSNFENWTFAENETDSLIGWSSSNAIVISPVISLYSETDSYQGDYAGNLVTAPFGFVQYSTIGVLVNGEAIFGYGGGGGGNNVELESGGGTPISYKPTDVKGHYRTTTLATGDLPFAKVLLTKYNTVLSQRDTVGYAEYNFDSSDDFTPFTIPVEDLMPDETPDTITTIFYSSNPSLVGEFGVWSNLYLDSVYLSPVIPTDIEINAQDISQINIFPNPSAGKIRVENLPKGDVQFAIYNAVGERLESFNTYSNETLFIDMSSYSSGVYFIRSTKYSGPSKRIILTR
jgi:hypothetical protein